MPTTTSAETFATESTEVAATFAAMRLALMSVALQLASSDEHRTQQLSKSFQAHYAAIREVQLAWKSAPAHALQREN